MKIVSIPYLKNYLEKTDTIQDDLLGSLIDGVSKRVETFLNRDLIKQSRTEVFDAGRKLYFLPAYPFDLTAAFTVTNNGVLQVLNSDYYIWEKEAAVEFLFTPTYYQPKQISITWTGGYLESPISQVTGTDSKIYTCKASHVSDPGKKPILGPEYESFWSLAGVTGGTWASGTQYYDHAFLSGVPEDIMMAVCMQCSYAHRRRKDVGLTSVSVPDGSKSWATESGGVYRPIGRSSSTLLPEVVDMLRPYRKVPTDR